MKSLTILSCIAILVAVSSNNVNAQICNPGNVLSILNNITSCVLCSRGYYCPGGILPAVLCPQGTYLLSFTGASLSDCVLCPAGYTCYGQAHLPLACIPGQWCTNGTYMSALGTFQRYQPNGGQSNKFKVQDGDGFYDNDSIGCPPGYYCPDPSAPEPTPCPCGTFNPYAESSDDSSCQLCTNGNYCPLASTLPSACTSSCRSSCSYGECTNC